MHPLIQIHRCSYVTYPSHFSQLPNFVCTFRQRNLNLLQPNTFGIVNTIHSQLVFECYHTICQLWLSLQWSILKLTDMVLPSNNRLLLLLQPPSWPYFLALANHTVFPWRNHFGTLLLGQFSVFQADWGFALCDTEIRGITMLIVTVQYDMEILRGGSGYVERVWNKLYYRRVETLGDAGEFLGWWRYTLVW